MHLERPPIEELVGTRREALEEKNRSRAATDENQAKWSSPFWTGPLALAGRGGRSLCGKGRRVTGGHGRHQAAPGAWSSARLAREARSRPRCPRSVAAEYCDRNTPHSRRIGTTRSTTSSSPVGARCGTRTKPAGRA